MNYEYFIQKHDISPKSLEKFDNDYDEDDSKLMAQIENMGALGWELCGVVRHKSDPNNAKFIYKRMFKISLKTRTNLNFGQALEALKHGKRVSRDGWNGKGMFLALAYPTKYPDKRVSAAIEFNHTFEGVKTSLNNFIAMKTVQNTLVPWLASQTDMLADDYYIID